MAKSAALATDGQGIFAGFNWADLYRGKVPAGKDTFFCHPAVKVQATPGRGRGLVLSDAVPEGELLFACGPFATAPKNKLQEAVVKKLQVCAQRVYERFFALCGGDDQEALDAETCGSLLLKGGPDNFSPGNDATIHRRHVDSARVERILRRNTHALDALDSYAAADEPSVCGVWLLPALLNHSCRPNVQRHFVGELMVCRSAQPLKQGTELLDAYVSALQPQHLRRERLLQDFGLECNCARCIVEGGLMRSSDASSLLDRLDAIVDEIKPETYGVAAAAFDGLVTEVRALVSKAAEVGVKRLTSDVAMRNACEELWPGSASRRSEQVHLQLVSLLLGSFVPTFKGAAFARRQTGEAVEAVERYDHCLEILEEVVPGCEYHALWAAERASQAKRAWLAATAGSDVSHAGALRSRAAHCAQYAKRWHGVCYGPAAFEPMMERFGWLEDVTAALQLAADEDRSPWEWSVEEVPGNEAGRLVVSISVPEGVEPGDIEIDVAPDTIVAALRGPAAARAHGVEALRARLPRAIDPARAPAAKYKRKGGRRLVLELPLAV